LILTSCKNESSVVPSASDLPLPQTLLPDELTSIQEYFDVNKDVTYLDNSNTKQNFEPRWDKVAVNNDRVEFDILESGKIPMTKLSKTGLNMGRLKYVYLRNAPNYTKRGLIVNFTPSEDFEGDIIKVNTRNYRELKFDGLITFFELNGEVADAYKAVNGLVTHKLEFKKKNDLNPRCGTIYVVDRHSYTMVSSSSGCTITDNGITASFTYGVPCIGYIDVTAGNNPGGGGGYGNSSGVSSDNIYGSFLASPLIRSMCAKSIAAGLEEASSNWNFVTGSGNPCLPNRTVNAISEYFHGFSVPDVNGNPGINADFLTINVYRLVTETKDIKGISERLASAYSTAVQQYSQTGRQEDIRGFTALWASKFNGMISNKGKYCIEIEKTDEEKKGDLARAFPLKDSSDPKCQ
jgi:hypothetical protein